MSYLEYRKYMLYIDATYAFIIVLSASIGIKAVGSLDFKVISAYQALLPLLPLLGIKFIYSGLSKNIKATLMLDSILYFITSIILLLATLTYNLTYIGYAYFAKGLIMVIQNRLSAEAMQYYEHQYTKKSIAIETLRKLRKTNTKISSITAAVAGIVLYMITNVYNIDIYVLARTVFVLLIVTSAVEIWLVSKLRP